MEEGRQGGREGAEGWRGKWGGRARGRSLEHPSLARGGRGHLRLCPFVPREHTGEQRSIHAGAPVHMMGAPRQGKHAGAAEHRGACILACTGSAS